MANSFVRLSRRSAARLFELHAGPGDRHDEPDHRGPPGARAAARAQRPLRRYRQRRRCRADGCLRLLLFQPLGVFFDGGVDDRRAGSVAALGPFIRAGPAGGATRRGHCPAPRPRCLRVDEPRPAELRRLRDAVHTWQCRDAAARRQFRDRACRKRGHTINRGRYRAAAAGCRRAISHFGTAGRSTRAAARAVPRVLYSANPWRSVRRFSGARNDGAGSGSRWNCRCLSWNHRPVGDERCRGQFGPL